MIDAEHEPFTLPDNGSLDTYKRQAGSLSYIGFQRVEPQVKIGIPVCVSAAPSPRAKVQSRIGFQPVSASPRVPVRKGLSPLCWCVLSGALTMSLRDTSHSPIEPRPPSSEKK